MSLEWICVVDVSSREEGEYGEGGMNVGGEERTYPEELAVGEHALLETGVQKADVILHQLVDGPRHGLLVVVRVAVLGVQTGHELGPVGLDDFGGAKVQQLLHEDEHPCPERPGPALPNLQRRVGPLVRPADAPRLRLPGGGELGLEVPQREQVSEEGLVPPDRLSADDERDGKGDRVVELERGEARGVLVALHGLACRSLRHLALFDAGDVDHPLQGLG